MLVWIIVSGVILFAAAVGFLLGRFRSRGGESDFPPSRRARLLPQKLSRVLWLVLPFPLTAGVALVGAARGLETGPLWAVFFAMLIIQAVIGGMFGLSADPVSTIVTGVFVAVEVLMIGGVFLFVVLGLVDFFVPYLVAGIGAIVACIVVAAKQAVDEM